MLWFGRASGAPLLRPSAFLCLSTPATALDNQGQTEKTSLPTKDIMGRICVGRAWKEQIGDQNVDPPPVDFAQNCQAKMVTLRPGATEASTPSPLGLSPSTLKHVASTRKQHKSRQNASPRILLHLFFLVPTCGTFSRRESPMRSFLRPLANAHGAKAAYCASPTRMLCSWG